ncbi:uncharacterized protein [Palaemon carinicauda]|uniref:uncharacterized protein n=1 Tax=Palaemon carinicauda TaxID=392227 RepID=UPI0035B59618
MINYYHRFLPAISATLAPLYASLKGKPKDLKWGPPQKAAFYNARKALSTATPPTFPIPHAPLLLSIDDSDITIGALLKAGGHRLTPPIGLLQQKTVQGRIGLFYLRSRIAGGALGCPYFRHFLEGTPFVIRTYRIPLVHASLDSLTPGPPVNDDISPP